MALFVDRIMVGFWWLEVDWTTFTYPVSAGSHQVTWIYRKGRLRQGQMRHTWTTSRWSLARPIRRSILWADGAPQRGRRQAGIHAEEPPAATIPGWRRMGMPSPPTRGWCTPPIPLLHLHQVTPLAVHTQEGQVLTFRYKVSSEEKMDLLRFVDGERRAQWSGELDWAVLHHGPGPGGIASCSRTGPTLALKTQRLDDVCVTARWQPPASKIQGGAASVPGWSVAKLRNVLRIRPSARRSASLPSDENIATVDENGIVTGISQGEATITVTAKDGGFTNTCLVTVTAWMNPCQHLRLYVPGFVADKGTYFREPMTWCTFTDTHPEEVIESVDACKDGVLRIVWCSAQSWWDTVYGYLSTAITSPWILKPTAARGAGCCVQRRPMSPATKISTTKRCLMVQHGDHVCDQRLGRPV